jgi:arylsulfatase A-like enzyme
MRIGLLLLLLACPCTADQPRPNIVIVFIDDFGWGDPSCYGNPHVKTPNLDRFAAQGVRFTQGYAASPICSPSRCGLMTGQAPGRWKITSYLQTKAGNRACEMADFLDPAAPSLPRQLQKAGYRTAHIGKWHLGGGRDVTDAPKFAAYGYDVGEGTYESPEPTAPLGLKTTPWGKTLEAQQVPRHDRTRWMVDRTLQFFQQNKEKPCFVNLWLDDTHTPFLPSPEQREAAGVSGGGEFADYKTVLHALDEQLGRLFRALPENTLVLVIGDNGALPTFDQMRVGNLRGSKLSLYEGGIRVPFLVRWPEGCPAARTANDITIISTLDLFPSLLKIAGAERPTHYVGDGEDLSEAFRGKRPERQLPLYSEYGRNTTAFRFPADAKHRSPNLAVRDGRWKLLMQDDGTDLHLYDLQEDAKETKDVLEDHLDIGKRLSEKLAAWRKSLP